MPIYTKEDNIALAINAIQAAEISGRKLSQRAAAKAYNIPKSSLNHRINN